MSWSLTIPSELGTMGEMRPHWFVLALFLAHLVSARAQDGGAPAANSPAATVPAAADAPAAAQAPNAPAEGGGDYEIDYEEEPESSADTGNEEGEEAPEATPAKSSKKVPKKPIAKKAAPVIDRNAPTSQGTRSKNKFAPMLKAESKSIYKKGGKFLDVDTD